MASARLRELYGDLSLWFCTYHLRDASYYPTGLILLGTGKTMLSAHCVMHDSGHTDVETDRSPYGNAELRLLYLKISSHVGE